MTAIPGFIMIVCYLYVLKIIANIFIDVIFISLQYFFNFFYENN